METLDKKSATKTACKSDQMSDLTEKYSKDAIMFTELKETTIKEKGKLQ